MYRVMGNKGLSIMIHSNPYLKNIAKNCESASELEQEIVKTTCLRTICLIDIDWSVVYKNVKED